jgi:hypothetical protein
MNADTLRTEEWITRLETLLAQLQRQKYEMKKSVESARTKRLRVERRSANEEASVEKTRQRKRRRHDTAG